MIAVVDLDMGNPCGVRDALRRVGGDAQIVRTPAGLARGEKIVLPGLGTFAEAIGRLHARRLVKPLLKAAVRDGTPLLSICLGLQLLFDVSYEDGQHMGLGILPGKVVRFEFSPGTTALPLRIPHTGWNRIYSPKPCPLLNGVENRASVYFAHSYHVVPINGETTAATTEYGYTFTSAVWRDNVFGIQFRPEKSQAVGLKLLENFVKL